MTTKPKKRSLAGLAALRSELPPGPPVTRWLVASREDGTHAGWTPVTRFWQKVGSAHSNPALLLPGADVQFAVIDDGGGVVVEVIGFTMTIRNADGTRSEDPSAAASLTIDGALLMTVGAKRTIAPDADIRVRAGRVTYRVHVASTEPTFARAAPMPVVHPAETLVVRALREEENLDLDGWLEIANGGELVCAGRVTCHGACIEEGGAFACDELVTTYLRVERAARTRFRARSVRARVVDVVEHALEDLIEHGAVVADYVQHFGRDLNPSWDYARGKNPLRPDLYEPGPGDLVSFHVAAIRDALGAGEDVFTHVRPDEILLDVYGRYRLLVQRDGERWRVLYVDNDGKRGLCDDIVIPPDLAADGVAAYVDDLLHESAAPGKTVRRVPP
jgi:hypothetical protein